MTKGTNFLKLARAAADAADAKKGRDIIIMNIRRLTAVADYFVIITADSAPQIRAIMDAVRAACAEAGVAAPQHFEGRNAASWAVLDYGGLVVHIMIPAVRELYAMEKVWGEARKTRVGKD